MLFGVLVLLPKNLRIRIVLPRGTTYNFVFDEEKLSIQVEFLDRKILNTVGHNINENIEFPDKFSR